MKKYNSYKELSAQKGTVVTLGSFDGVHLGHRSILKRLTQDTANNHLESVVLTFFPHPRMVLNQNEPIFLLNTIEEKSKLLEEIGVQHLVIQEFTKDFSELTAEEFVEQVLVKHFNIRKIIIGYDHRFGNNRSADIFDLIHLGNKYRFDVEQITAQEIDEVSISSTKIRKALLEGNVKVANEYLGSNYSLTGPVVKGKQLGRMIGFPTANISLAENYKLIPKKGAYVVKTLISDKEVWGMMNIGNNPTVNDAHILNIEVHLLDFSEDIYGEKITVELIDFLREEEKFNSLDELIAQLNKDREQTKNIVKKRSF